MTTKWLTKHEIVVTSVARASNLLMSTRTAGDVDAIISIADPYQGKRPPKDGFYRVPHRLILAFDDITRSHAPEDVLPTRGDAESVLNFARRARVRPGRRFLIHCFAGISRSTATALGVIADRMGPGCEAEAVAHLVECCEDGEPFPNDLLVQHFDDVLGRQGALIKASSDLYRTWPVSAVARTWGLRASAGVGVRGRGSRETRAKRSTT